MDIRDLLAGRSEADLKVVRPNSTLREAAQTLTSHQIGALLVTGESGQLIGIVSERDLVRAITEYDGGMVERSVSDVMTRSVVTCAAHDSIGDVLNLMKSNGIRHIPVLDGDRLQGIVSIRELTRAYEALQVQANTDALTGLSNRRYFLETLQNELDRSRRFRHTVSVAMIDVDHFKRVNDKYGHDVGDKVLCVLASLLVRELRTIDRVGRLGGEEFAAIFPETGMEGANTACARLLEAVRTSEIDTNDAKISFTVSIGLTGANSATEGPSSVLRRADKLMYEAKAEGRDRIQMDAL
jgi:diguanylate cyclase (GGDEF)-like protein